MKRLSIAIQEKRRPSTSSNDVNASSQEGGREYTETPERTEAAQEREAVREMSRNCTRDVQLRRQKVRG